MSLYLLLVAAPYVLCHQSMIFPPPRKGQGTVNGAGQNGLVFGPDLGVGNNVGDAAQGRLDSRQFILQPHPTFLNYPCGGAPIDNYKGTIYNGGKDIRTDPNGFNFNQGPTNTAEVSALTAGSEIEVVIKGYLHPGVMRIAVCYEDCMKTSSYEKYILGYFYHQGVSGGDVDFYKAEVRGKVKLPMRNCERCVFQYWDDTDDGRSYATCSDIKITGGVAAIDSVECNGHPLCNCKVDSTGAYGIGGKCPHYSKYAYPSQQVPPYSWPNTAHDQLGRSVFCSYCIGEGCPAACGSIWDSAYVTMKGVQLNPTTKIVPTLPRYVKCGVNNPCVCPGCSNPDPWRPAVARPTAAPAPTLKPPSAAPAPTLKPPSAAPAPTLKPPSAAPAPTLKPPSAPAPTSQAVSGDCIDDNQLCSSWARNGECSKNPGYMLKSCKLSCQVCVSKPTAASAPTNRPTAAAAPTSRPAPTTTGCTAGRTKTSSNLQAIRDLCYKGYSPDKKYTYANYLTCDSCVLKAAVGTCTDQCWVFAGPSPPTTAVRPAVRPTTAPAPTKKPTAATAPTNKPPSVGCTSGKTKTATNVKVLRDLCYQGYRPNRQYSYDNYLRCDSCVIKAAVGTCTDQCWDFNAPSPPPAESVEFPTDEVLDPVQPPAEDPDTTALSTASKSVVSGYLFALFCVFCWMF